MEFASGDKLTLATPLLKDETRTSCDSYPTYETTRVALALGTEMEKLPSSAVVVATLVPFIATVAPEKGFPSVPVTLPVILVCAIAKKENEKKRIKKHACFNDPFV